jgi:type II secretion system protein G
MPAKNITVKAFTLISKACKGFTLIELLVTISIIGILSTLLVANFNSTRQRARDAQRKSDLRNIQTALRLYYNDCGAYPSASGGLIRGCNGTCDAPEDCVWDGNTPFTLTGQNFMNVLPQDPQYDPDTGENSYTYIAGADSDSYTLRACLENASDDKCGAACGDNGCYYSVSP